ncbi:MAG: glycosyltransferase family 2 protein [Planctomycetia bacterium]
MITRAATVVVPSFGRPRQLRACLDALAGQSFTEPWDVLVVDDGSPEPYARLADEFAGRLDLRVIRQDNSGPASARNHGVQQARGEFVALTDDDCLPEPVWLETLVRAARQRPFALVGGTTFNGFRDELFASTSHLVVDMVYEHFNSHPDDAYFLASNNLLCLREQFLEVGGFDTGFHRAGAEDREFCDRWRMAGLPIVWRPEARVEHRHSQTLREFVDLHFRYGRGARMYQVIRRERGSGTMREDLGFQRSVPRRVVTKLAALPGVARRLQTVAALATWQVANAAGFATEVVTKLHRR